MRLLKGRPVGRLKADAWNYLKKLIKKSATVRAAGRSRGHLENGGHGDKELGHLSLRDPRGRGFWMKRSGISLAELQGPQDFILLDFEGKKKVGKGTRHAEWPIHGEVLLARSDVNVVGHTHPYNAGVISTTEEPVEALTKAGAFFSSGLPRYRKTSNLIIQKNMGAGLASALDTRGNSNANHVSLTLVPM